MQTTFKLHFVDNFSEGDSKAQVKAMGNYFELTDKEPNYIYCGSIAKMNEALMAVSKYRKPLIVYCWDYYSWSHKKINQSGDWNKYEEFLKMAQFIFVPSKAQQLRLKELLGLDSHVVTSGYPTYELPISDKGFILDPVRYYPDVQSKWAVQAAERLGIPIVHSEHQFSLKEFRELVASCTFMTSTTQEASTGGLTLMEGLNLGKVSLISNSPYMGAKDYLKDSAVYFQHDDFEDLVKKMSLMWETRPRYNGIVSQTSYDLMANKIHHIITNGNTVL